MQEPSVQNLPLYSQVLSFEERMFHVKNLKKEEAWAQGLLLKDEWANILTHGLGLILSFIGFLLLIEIPLKESDHWRLLTFTVYGGSLILLYTASTVYHALRHPKLKRAFRLVDHCAIYLLIAGSYTPFTLLLLEGSWGWTLFSMIWSLAIFGILFKIFFRYRFERLSTSLYLFMGWLVVIAIDPLVKSFHVEGLSWLLAGGLCYTIGVVFYIRDQRRFYHAIWHLFVLGGSACHFFAVLLYL